MNCNHHHNHHHHHHLPHHWLQKPKYSRNDLQLGHNKKFRPYLHYMIQIPKANPINSSAFLRNCIKILWLLTWRLSTDYHNRGNLVLFNSNNQSIFKTDGCKQQNLWYSQLKPTPNVNTSACLKKSPIWNMTQNKSWCKGKSDINDINILQLPLTFTLMIRYITSKPTKTDQNGTEEIFHKPLYWICHMMQTPSQ